MVYTRWRWCAARLHARREVCARTRQRWDGGAGGLGDGGGGNGGGGGAGGRGGALGAVALAAAFSASLTRCAYHPGICSGAGK
eukprot:scaffold71515_cov32-Tisochrysis_lutea.AAC.2